MKRYAMAASAVVMQLCLGGIYAWSAFVPSLRGQFGYSAAQMQLVFGCAVGTLTFSMLVTGRLLDRYGPRVMCMTAALLVCLGYNVAGMFGDRFGLLWLGISIINGLGVACGYLATISVGVNWFPDRKGLISGIVVAGYGGGAILLSSIVEALSRRGWTALEIFRVVGLVYGPIILAAASVLSMPPRSESDNAAPDADNRLLAMLRDRRIWPLMTGLACGTFPGLVVIGNLKPMGMGFGIPELQAVAAISVFAVGNMLGRVAWGALQDRFGARLVSVISLSLIACSPVAYLIHRDVPSVFLAVSAFCGFCYGGSLSIYAAQAATIFGKRRLGSVYPVALIGHGMAAIVGPYVNGWAIDLTGSVVPALVLAGLVGLAGAIVYARLTRETVNAR